ARDRAGRPRHGGRRPVRGQWRPPRPRRDLDRPRRSGRDCGPGSEPGRDAEGPRRLRRGSRSAGRGRARRATRRVAEPVLRRRVVAPVHIAAIETREYRFPLEPPFHAAWDPEPRAHQEATVVIVRSDDGVEGYASGDGLPDRALLERLLVGL